MDPDKSRIATLLRNNEMRTAVQELSGQQGIAPSRATAFTSDMINEHLRRPRAIVEHVEFFDRNRLSEAIILDKLRPSLLIRDSLFEISTVPVIEKKIKPARQRMAKPIGSIGRIELFDHDTFDWCGTGWRVDEDLVITNRHVAEVFTQRQGSTFRFALNRRGKRVRASIDFREEYGGEESAEYAMAEIVWVADDDDRSPDMAVLRIAKTQGLPDPLELAAKDPVADQWMGVVGYPAYDSRNDSGLLSEVFKDRFDVKRFAPGTVVLPGKGEWYFTHDASTTGGASGSGVLSLDDGKVIGLHFGGVFRETNYAVKASAIKKILASKSWVPVGRSELPKELAVPTEGFSDFKRTKAYMADRDGYDGSFLGKKVDAPKAGARHTVLSITGSDRDLLDYTHFSIQMSEDRRLCLFTAENLDGGLKKPLKRKDRWGYDPRILKEQQVGHFEFYGPQPFDKGHMVRRENPGWGAKEAEALLGEEDSFIYTNAVPQMPDLNQKTWLSLENYVLQNAKVEGFKVNVFTGPVLREDDPEYEGVRVPLDFWKIVVAVESGTNKLLASAYLLTQEGMMPTEGFRYGPFKTYQVALKYVEELTDLKFPKNVRDADVFGQESLLELNQRGRMLEVREAGDIIL